MKQTKNRAAIIKCLTEPDEDCGGAPPYSASSIEYMFSYNYKWYGMEKPISISQINRTLRDLLADGLIVSESRLDEAHGNRGLPQRVNYWQMADALDRNRLLLEVRDACSTAGKAHGMLLFGGYVYQPMDAEQKDVVIKDLKAMMQRTHPDKIDGYSDQFRQLNEALTYVRSTVDLLKEPDKRLR
jgi:hypothetical protein